MSVPSKDQYDVLEPLGTGSFGSVFKIRRKIDGKILVWKEINFGSFNDKEKSYLVSEVNILRELRSPFIVKYYDRIVDKANARLFIIMEHCSGGDLGKLIQKCKRDKTYLDESFILKVLSQCILALKDCHRRVDANGAPKPILHRDLKPANILLDDLQNVKAGDFGLAKELSNQARFAQTNVGSPLYMAPEITNGRSYDEKTDIWSLGCLIYELTALRPPFEATNAINLAVKINAGKYPRIPTRYSDGLYDILRSMIQTDPRRRPRIQELDEHPFLTSYMNKAKALITEHQNQAMLSNKMRELSSREANIKAKEEMLDRREKQLLEQENILKEREQQLEHDRKKLPAQLHVDAKKVAGASELPADQPNPLAHKVPIPYRHQLTVGGFQIHCDNTLPPPPPSINNTHTHTMAPATTNNMTGHVYHQPTSRLAAVAAGQGVKRVQDIISARPLAVDKENIPVSMPTPIISTAYVKQPNLNVLGRRGLREQHDMNMMMDENNDEVETPKKKPRTFIPSQAIDTGNHTNHDNIGMIKHKYTNIMNMQVQDKENMHVGNAGDHDVNDNNPFIPRHRMPPPPPILRPHVGGI